MAGPRGLHPSRILTAAVQGHRVHHLGFPVSSTKPSTAPGLWPASAESSAVLVPDTWPAGGGGIPQLDHEARLEIGLGVHLWYRCGCSGVPSTSRPPSHLKALNKRANFFLLGFGIGLNSAARRSITSRPWRDGIWGTAELAGALACLR